MSMAQVVIGFPGSEAALLRARSTTPSALIRLWHRRRAYRAELRRLLRLGPYLIEDVGLAVEAAVLEAGKPFWRA